jgi:hypothetical protein
VPECVGKRGRFWKTGVVEICFYCCGILEPTKFIDIISIQAIMAEKSRVAVLDLLLLDYFPVSSPFYFLP